MDHFTSAADCEFDSTTTRPVASEDNEFLYELYKTMRALEMGLVDWDDNQKEQFLQMQFQAQQTHYQSTFPAAEHQIILLDGRSIGRIYVDRTPDEIRLLDIILLPAYRNLGIGKTFLQQLQNEAANKNVPVRFYVWQFNLDAQRFYHRLGFQTVTEAGAYIQMEWNPQEVMPAINMR